MDSLLLWIGRLCALVGVVLCAVAVAARLADTYFLGVFQVGTVLQAGTVALLAASVFLLLLLTRRSRR